MPAHRSRPSARFRGSRWLAGFVAAGVLAAAAFLVAGPADASAATVSAQLSLTGIATQSSPLGGSVVGIHPGDSLVFSAATVPTAGLSGLGLSDLANSLLTTVLGYSVTLDASGLPGGAKKVALTGAASYKLTFPKVGTYSLSWTASGLLGAINLNANELQGVGVAFNASTGWTAKIVVAADPPPGGLAVQLPSVKVAPSVPVLGRLPTVQVPGVTTSSIPTSGVAPVGGGTGGHAGGGSATPNSSSGVSALPGYSLPGLTVPDLVVPKGDGSFSDGGGGLGGLASVFGPLRGAPLTVPEPTNSSGAVAVPPDSASAGGSASPKRVVDLATTSGPAGRMPVLLAVLAILALSLVTATYARLYLLRRKV
ncbi:MAG TPA: hypothetical protein VK816_00370 [Jatrophihabitantaceae bacterium]|jgi:hypothetical protein|nr:hypothetical protein [Jatrophihabitantaceae bacterium]